MIVVEQPTVFPSSRTPTSPAGMEQGSQGEGTTSSHSSPEEKFSDNISSASEASETTSGSQYSHKKSSVASGYRCWSLSQTCLLSCLGLLHSSSTATDICFSRQTDSSDVDSQTFPGAEGNVTALRPGAIDNQPLVTSEPLKVGSFIKHNHMPAIVKQNRGEMHHMLIGRIILIWLSFVSYCS